MLWHVSAVSLDTGFDVPARQFPFFLASGTLLGLACGLLRQISGSVVVPSVCHALWNGIDYPFYGFGEKVGALGIEQTHLYGPEVGVLGVAVNAIVVATLWWWVRTHSLAAAASPTPSAV